MYNLKDEEYYIYMYDRENFAAKYICVSFMSLTAPSFVGTVRTIDASIAEIQSRKARAISASQTFLIAFAILQQRLRWLDIYEKLLKFHITIRYNNTSLSHVYIYEKLYGSLFPKKSSYTK